MPNMTQTKSPQCIGVWGAIWVKTVQAKSVPLIHGTVTLTTWTVTLIKWDSHTYYMDSPTY